MINGRVKDFSIMKKSAVSFSPPKILLSAFLMISNNKTL